MRFETDKQRRKNVPESDREGDETKGCGEMEEDRWGGGKRERNGGCPDGTVLCNF